MTAPHQDARIEDAIESSAAKIVDAIVTAVGDNVLGIEVGLALYATRSDLAQVARGALLDLLATLGVDTSAHVHAPEVEVRVHREPHDTEGG